MKPYRVVEQSRSYPVFIGSGLLGQTGSLLRSAGVKGRPFLIVPEGLRDTLGAEVAKSFERIDTIAFDDGESRKTLDTIDSLIDALLGHGARRDSLVVVAGGGMAGDTAGFAASVFLRGVELVHVPTTLLAQVDSSIGGKVAVNHSRGKNLVGSFYPPAAVIADVRALQTLPPRELLSGLFEALKGGVIADPELFDTIVSARGQIAGARDAAWNELLTAIVKRAVDVKADIVSADEREGDLRRLLNYGHTVAHGLETAMNYEGITHGEAVAWGMIGANALAVKRGLLPVAERSRIDAAIASFAPVRLPDLSREAVLAPMEHDKKFTGTKRVMVLPVAVGKCEIVDDVTEQELAYAVDAVLQS